MDVLRVDEAAQSAIEETAEECRPAECFAVVKLWPGISVAEDEVIERLKIAAVATGRKCLVIDAEGRILPERKEYITRDEVAFVIHPHFSTPKCYDAFSFYPVWNPIQFYFDWGYARQMLNILSHDDFLTSGSRVAEDHIRRLVNGSKEHLPIAFELYPSSIAPRHKPALMQRRVFYVGINWEKIGKQRSRHHDILTLLEKRGLIDIYGPSELHGVRVWADFKCYAGELPFDGKSVISAIAKAGIGLCLSSDAHLQSNIMSNRLFETLAAGAVAICDRNKFVEERMGDTVLYVRSDQGGTSTAAQIIEHVEWLNANPAEALRLAEASQAIFRQQFQLDDCLNKIFSRLPARQRDLRMVSCGVNPAEKVDLICLFSNELGKSFADHAFSIQRQNPKNLRVVLAVPRACRAALETHLATAVWPRQYEVQIIESQYDLLASGSPEFDGFGRMMASVVGQIELSPFFSFLVPGERLFTEQISPMRNALLADPNMEVAQCSYVRRWPLAEGSEDYDHEIVEDFELSHDWLLGGISYGRFLFRKSVWDDVARATAPYLHLKSILALVLERRVVRLAKSGVVASRYTCTGKIPDRRIELGILSDTFSSYRHSLLCTPSTPAHLTPHSFSIDLLSTENKRQLLYSLLRSVKFRDIRRKHIKKLKKSISKRLFFWRRSVK